MSSPRAEARSIDNSGRELMDKEPGPFSCVSLASLPGIDTDSDPESGSDSETSRKEESKHPSM